MKKTAKVLPASLFADGFKHTAMTEKRKRGNPPGSNNGGGKRRSPRSINPKPYGGRLYIDQGNPSAVNVRGALDLYNRITAAGKMEAVEGILNK